MSRITLVTPEKANAEQAELYSAIYSQLGMVPNFLKVVANSPAALRAFLGLQRIASEGDLDFQTRARIALALAQQNACQYCVSANTALGYEAGLSSAEMRANRAGASHNPKADMAIKFALALADNSGDISNADFLAIRFAGYNDADIVEIITHVGMNMLTNIIGKASRAEIDFPKIELGTNVA